MTTTECSQLFEMKQVEEPPVEELSSPPEVASQETESMKNIVTNNNNNNDGNENSSGGPPLYLLYCIILLQSLIFLSEMIIDQMVHSMLILADAYHHLFNTFNAILLVVCFKISNQITLMNTFGWVRTEVLGMLTTITFIVALIFSLLIEGFLQLFHLHEISGPTNPRVLAILGGWSLLVNLMYVLIINGLVTDKKYKQTTREDRSFTTTKCEPITGLKRSISLANIQIELPISDQRTSSTSPSSPGLCHSIIQGVLSPCFLLICSLSITMFNGSEFVEMFDPSIGIITAISLCITFYPQLKNTFLILMQTVPQNINIIQLKREILERFQIIQNIHEFHIWLLTGSKIVATCHIVLPPCDSTKKYWKLFEEIQKFLKNKYGIQYMTIQPEFQISSSSSMENFTLRRHSSCLTQCLIRCPPPSPNGHTDPDCSVAVCETKTCCPDAATALPPEVITTGHQDSSSSSSSST